MLDPVPGPLLVFFVWALTWNPNLKARTTSGFGLLFLILLGPGRVVVTFSFTSFVAVDVAYTLSGLAFRVSGVGV